MIDMALGRMLDSPIMTSEPSCVAIAAVSIGSHMEIMPSDMALSSQCRKILVTP